MDQNTPNTHNPLLQLTENMINSAFNYQKGFMHLMASADDSEKPKDPMHIAPALAHASQEIINHPEKLVNNLNAMLKDYTGLYNDIYKQMLGEGSEPSSIKDNRFKDEAWENNPYFKFIKNAYYINSSAIKNTISDLEELDTNEKRKLDFMARGIIDAASPTNNLMTNPEVLKQIIETNGDSLVKGSLNFLHDVEHSVTGQLKITTTDLDAFHVGENLAVTKGKVVYQNEMMQLIQYEPTTAKVCKTPLIVMPAWINKYYILDLQDKNSFVKWLVDQGHTVFMISWVNPSSKFNDKGFEDYMKEGPLAALEVVKKITSEEQVNFMGYCLGGTLLASTLAYLKQQKHKNFPVSSATFLTTLVDFENAGDLCVFIDEEQLSALEERMNEKGYLDGTEMAATFSMIRANDMIWSFVVNNYMLGKDPFPFDVLFWNADSTRLPAKMHSFYLRNMYLNNSLKDKGGVSLAGVPIDLSSIDIPTYILSTREDHIAPWEATFKANHIYQGKNRFVLSASGHVVGVVNHPSKNKYCYWTNDKMDKDPKKWLETAKETAGSWWLDWDAWAKNLTKEQVDARKIGKSIENAPGSYAKMQLKDLD